MNFFMVNELLHFPDTKVPKDKNFRILYDQRNSKAFAL